MILSLEIMKGFLTTNEAAARLKVSGARVRQMILAGLIKGVEKVGQNNLIPEKEIVRLEKSDRPAGRPTMKKS
jgi:excisionase family DNA binding protein